MGDPQEAKRRLMVTFTERMWVDVDAETAEQLLPMEPGEPDGEPVYPEHLNVCEAAARFRRIARYSSEHFDGDVEIEDATGDTPWYSEAVDGEGQERYIWSARHFVMNARHELSLGRYREGNCPDLDRLNGRLGRLEEELRLMALAIDHPEMPEVAAWKLSLIRHMNERQDLEERRAAIKKEW